MKRTSIKLLFKGHVSRQAKDCTRYLFYCLFWNWALQAPTDTPAETVSVLDRKHKGGTGCFTLAEQLSQVKIKLLVVWVKCKVNASPQPGEKQTKEERAILQLRPTVLLPSRKRGSHWAPLSWKELSVELGNNPWPSLHTSARLILFVPLPSMQLKQTLCKYLPCHRDECHI